MQKGVIIAAAAVVAVVAIVCGIAAVDMLNSSPAGADAGKVSGDSVKTTAAEGGKSTESTENTGSTGSPESTVSVGDAGNVGSAGGEITVEEGKESVLKFIGDDSLKLSDVKFANEVTYFSQGDYYQYNVDGGSGIGKAAAYVSKDNGRVEMISFYDKRSDAEKEKAITLDQAKENAWRYIAEKYPEFVKMNTVEIDSEYNDHMAGGKDYILTWRESVDGVQTLNIVTLSVDAVNGEILSYMALNRDYDGTMTPKLSEEEAYAKAIEAFPGIEVTEKSCTLSVEYVEKGRPALSYTVMLKGKPVNYASYGGIVLIDAESGEIMLKSGYN